MISKPKCSIILASLQRTREGEVSCLKMVDSSWFCLALILLFLSSCVWVAAGLRSLICSGTAAVSNEIVCSRIMVKIEYKNLQDVVNALNFHILHRLVIVGHNVN